MSQSTSTSTSSGPRPDALQVARLLLLAVYRETTPRAATLRHSAVALVDSCRRARPAARNELERLRQELALAQRTGRIDEAAAGRLSRLVHQATESHRGCRTARVE